MRIAVFEDDRKFAASLERLNRQYTHYSTAINTGDIGGIARWIERMSELTLYLLDIILDDKTAGLQLADLIEKQQGLLLRKAL